MVWPEQHLWPKPIWTQMHLLPDLKNQNTLAPLSEKFPPHPCLLPLEPASPATNHLPTNTFYVEKIVFYDEETWVTDEPSVVLIWTRPRPIQLCVGHKCLVFQLLRARYIPESLIIFLAKLTYNFCRSRSRWRGKEAQETVWTPSVAHGRYSAWGRGIGQWFYEGLKKSTEEILGKE